MRSLSSSLWTLTHLTALHINDNNLTRIPPDIAKLPNLVYLNLSSNKLRSLPAELGNMVSLRWDQCSLEPRSDHKNPGQLSHDLAVANKCPAADLIIYIGINEQLNSAVGFGTLLDMPMRSMLEFYAFSCRVSHLLTAQFSMATVAKITLGKYSAICLGDFIKIQIKHLEFMQYKFKKNFLNPKHGASNFIIEHICFLICHIAPQQPDVTRELNKVTVSDHHKFHHSHFKTLVRCLSEATLSLQLICFFK